MIDEERLREQLALLKSEHSDLDQALARLSEQSIVDELSIRRMKKRKLYLKDIIAKIEEMLIPDIIA
tara:strand:+ start:137 stop:337 length:201 start_codon:yes stop_codon:yes gene_type:complete